MSVHDDLSRLMEGECSAEERAELLARIEQDPEARALWTLLGELPAQFDALLHTPPPPDLDERILAAAPRPAPSLRWVLPWLLLAAAVLWALWPRGSAELLLAQGTQQIEGQASVLAGDARIEVDGIVEVSVEPPGGIPRVTERGGDLLSRRRTLLAAGAGAVVTVVVYEGTARVWAGDAPTVLHAGQSTRVGAPASRSARPPAPPEAEPSERVRALEAENKLLQSMLTEMETEYRGTPIPWPADLPEALRPEAFERNVRSAIETCAPDVELLGFECDEPPCFALLRPTEDDWWDRLVNQCPAWTDNYTSSVSTASGKAECLDGSVERYQILGWSSHLIEPPGGYSRAEQENQSKRFRARISEIERSWRCAE